MASLYAINDIYLRLLEEIELADDAQRAVIYKQLQDADQDFNEKAENYAKLMLNLTASADSKREESRRLLTSARADEMTVDWLKNQMLEAMKLRGVKRVDTKIGHWSSRSNGPAVQILDETKIPEEYRIKQPDKINKAAIIDAYKTGGEIVPGTEVTRGESITFK